MRERLRVRWFFNIEGRFSLNGFLARARAHCPLTARSGERADRTQIKLLTARSGERAVNVRFTTRLRVFQH